MKPKYNHYQYSAPSLDPNSTPIFSPENKRKVNFPVRPSLTNEQSSILIGSPQNAKKKTFRVTNCHRCKKITAISRFDSFAFCMHCSASIGKKPGEKFKLEKECEKCKQKSPQIASFCMHCGSKFKKIKSHRNSRKLRKKKMLSAREEDKRNK